VSPAVTVHKLDHEGREIWAYPGRVLRRTASSVTLEGRFDREDVVVAGLPIRRGDRMVETFYRNRWYNVFAVYAGQSEGLRGWYCNITRPAHIEARHIYADDLALDLVVFPGGGNVVLDEEEFEALPLSDSERGHAREALRDLQARATSRRSPFMAAG
jgi:predicted RNA-binding protein associated with RNAse of E/G family